jgi:hypothetical protein
MFGDPSGVWLIFEIAAESVNEKGICFQRAQAAGLSGGENAFHIK